MQYLKLILITFGIIVFGVVSYFGIKSFNRYTDVLAINACTQDYRQQITKDDKTVITRPLEQQATECAYNKGVKTWTGVWSDLPK